MIVLALIGCTDAGMYSIEYAPSASHSLRPTIRPPERMELSWGAEPYRSADVPTWFWASPMFQTIQIAFGASASEGLLPALNSTNR